MTVFVTFRLASGDLFLYEVEVARRREAPRREFLWPGVAARCAESQPTSKKMTNPFEFVQQVRAEAAKVIWPTRRETLITTGLVLLLVVFTSVFFLVVDEVLRTIVSLVLGFGRSG
jgi:preprotein translocase subunit SecE